MISEKDICLDYFSLELRWYWTGCSERRFGSATDIGGPDHVVLLDPFTLVGVGIYRRVFTCHSALPVELAEAFF